MTPSLKILAQRACIKNVGGITDVGDLPYEMVRPILRKVEIPEQLRTIEQASPQIAGEDAELWQAFIKRDIQNGSQKLETNRPKNPLSWWKVYRKLKREDEERLNAAEDQLKAALNKHKVTKEGNSTNILHTIIPTAKKSSWGGGPRDKPSGMQALKNAKSARDRLTILQRQTASRQAGRSVTQSIPSHELQQKRSVITRAPASMVAQHTLRNNPIAHKPLMAPPPQQHSRTPVFVGKTNIMSQQDRLINAEIRKEQAEKERRLRALTSAADPAARDSSNKTTAQQRTTAAPPAPVAAAPRKRAAYDPMMPAKRRKP